MCFCVYVRMCVCVCVCMCVCASACVCVYLGCFLACAVTTLNWEIFATNNIHIFCELIQLANSFDTNIPVHIPKYRYRQSMVRPMNIFSRELFCLPDSTPIREIYCFRIFPDLGMFVCE